MATAPNERKFRVQPMLVVTISVCFLIFIWHRNYNLLGGFYDYSILTSAVGYLHSGLLPYRDFTTPLQSLTIYLCDAAELVFGRSYLALAYGNLTLGLLAFYVLLRMLQPVLSFIPRVIIALAFTVSTFFQHGILWYNSVAMLLLAATCLQAAKFVHAPEIRSQDVLKFCLLLFLSSTCKLNFHALGMGIVFLAFAAHCMVNKTKIKSIFLCAGCFIIAGIILGPAFEILINRTTLDNFIENVLRTPTARSAGLITFFNPKLIGGSAKLLNIFNPHLYVEEMHDFYPDSWISGVYLTGFLIYFCCLCIALRPPREPEDARAPVGAFFMFSSMVVFPLFFFTSVLLSVTNVETEILTSFFLVIGLVSMLLLLIKYLSLQQRLAFQSAITIFASYFLLVGSVSAFMHSRVRLLEPSWSAAMLKAVHKQHTLSAMKDAVPFFDAQAISPVLEPYFADVHFTEPAQKRLTRLVSFMERFQANKDAPDIYWGPGLEILNRVYGGQHRARLPLWYHVGVTVREQDAARIIREFGNARYDWIVAADLKSNMPHGINDYVTKNYECVEDDEIVVYHRIH